MTTLKFNDAELALIEKALNRLRTAEARYWAARGMSPQEVFSAEVEIIAALKAEAATWEARAKLAELDAAAEKQGITP